SRFWTVYFRNRINPIHSPTCKVVSESRLLPCGIRPSLLGGGPPLRSEGSPLRSEGPPLRSEGPPLRSEGPPLRSEGTPLRSKGPPLRSEGTTLVGSVSVYSRGDGGPPGPDASRRRRDARPRQPR